MSRIIKKLRKPCQDDQIVADVALNLYAYSAMLVGHRMGIFKALANKPKLLTEIAKQFNLERKATEVLLSVGTSLNLVALTGEGYTLTNLGEDYLLDCGPTYFGGFWDLLIDNSDSYSIEGIEQAIKQNKPQVYDQENIYDTHTHDLERAKRFALGMNSFSIGAATTWPDKLDLSKCRRMLDIAGGLGIHSIGAVTRWPSLNSLIFDMPNVCQLAKENIADYGFQQRITTQAGDIWNDPFPQAELHFYSQIFHDWSPEKNGFLVKKSFDNLSAGGRIVIHELLYNESKTGPLSAAAYSVMLLAWLEGERSTALNLKNLLRENGFIDVVAIPSFGHCTIITGIKP